jgi:hypothetical protein
VPQDRRGDTNLVLTRHQVNTKLRSGLQQRDALPYCQSMREPMTRKTLSLPDSLWAAIDRYRANNLIGSEVEAVRRLLLDALRAGGFEPEGPAKAP